MSERPLVSVVVPFFDSERYLAACIESLLVQQGVDERYEILLIDNGSSDGSAAIAGRYDEVRLLREPKRGAYAARNAGIRAASAPVIALTDADCVVGRGWLRAILDGMREPRTAILLGACSYGGGASWPLRLLGAWENAKAEYVLGHCEPAHHFAYANNMAVRTSVFDEIGPFEEWQRAADSELVHRLAARRPELEVRFDRGMEVTHLEFERGRARAERLKLYRRTNSQIATFRELGPAQRVGVLVHLLAGRRAKA